MLKICKVCHKYFQGEEDVCPKCSPKIEDIRRKEEKKQAVILKVKERITPTNIIIVTFAIIILIIIISLLGQTKRAYNLYAKDIYNIAKEYDAKFTENAKAIDSDGIIYYGENIKEKLYFKDENESNFTETLKSIEEYDFLSNIDFQSYRDGTIKRRYNKANKLKWLIIYDDGGEVAAVICAKDDNSEKIGIYEKEQNIFQYKTINEFKTEQTAIQEKSIHDYKQLLINSVEMNEKAAIIKDYIVANYRPDGIDKEAFYSNIDEEFDNDEITKELSKMVDGKWIVSYLIWPSTDEYDKESYCVVYWSDNESSKNIGTTFNVIPIDEEEYSLEEKLKKHSSEVKLIGCDEWEEHYGKEWTKLMEEEQKLTEEKEKQKLRDQTFSGNRSLDDIEWFSSPYKDEYTPISQNRLQINSLSVRMEDGEMVIKISVESKIEFGRNWVVSIGYYDAAGERKGIFNCDLEYIAGQEAIEASFSGVPNCADHLKYYRVISIEDRK